MEKSLFKEKFLILKEKGSLTDYLTEEPRDLTAHMYGGDIGVKISGTSQKAGHNVLGRGIDSVKTAGKNLVAGPVVGTAKAGLSLASAALKIPAAASNIIAKAWLLPSGIATWVVSTITERVGQILYAPSVASEKLDAKIVGIRSKLNERAMAEIQRENSGGSFKKAA